MGADSRFCFTEIGGFFVFFKELSNKLDLYADEEETVLLHSILCTCASVKGICPGIFSFIHRV